MLISHVIYADGKSATDGKSSTWPQGEPQSVRDAYDAQQKGGKK
ncbi:hypothetical protein ABZ801_30560 [Actinomadura sp. NPDC047616]